MSKPRLLLLDAGIVTRLIQWGYWYKVISSYEVHLAGTVIDEVERGYPDDNDQWCSCSIQQYIDSGEVFRFDLSIKQLIEFASLFGSQFLDALHGGEQESLAQLFALPETDTAICSGDNIVFRILGAMLRGYQGISMEEVLSAIGITYIEMPHNFKKKWREQLTHKGKVEGFSGVRFKE